MSSRLRTRSINCPSASISARSVPGKRPLLCGGVTRARLHRDVAARKLRDLAAFVEKKGVEYARNFGGVRFVDGAIGRLVMQKFIVAGYCGSGRERPADKPGNGQRSRFDCNVSAPGQQQPHRMSARWILLCGRLERPVDVREIEWKTEMLSRAPEPFAMAAEQPVDAIL